MILVHPLFIEQNTVAVRAYQERVSSAYLESQAGGENPGRHHFYLFYFALPIMVLCVVTARFSFIGSDPDRPFVSDIIRKIIDKTQHSLLGQKSVPRDTAGFSLVQGSEKEKARGANE